MSGSAGPGAIGPILGATVRADWSQFEGVAALRCTIGVAIPLLLGLALRQSLVSVFGAVGAVSVGFGSFQGAYRSRAAVMLCASLGMASAVFIGSLAGFSHPATIAATTLAAFASGMLVALGPAAAFVGLQSVVAVLLAGGYPTDPARAALRAGIVLGGGLIQTLLVVLIWPLQRFSVERRAIAAAYRSLAGYASRLPAADAAAPEPHTFAATASPRTDPQPFARAGDVLVFQALLDEAERIRASLAGYATEQRRSLETDPACANTLPQWVGRALLEIAAALEGARDPREETPIWEPLEACARQLPQAPALDALLGQTRAAWRMASVLTSAADRPVGRTRVTPLRRRPPVRDALTTLRANLTLQSTACRHALRLAVVMALGTSIYRLLELPRGYWLPMTALLVLKPDFHETFAHGLARIAGTILGAAVATLIVLELLPGPVGLTMLVLGCVWGCYALFRTNYALFTACVTGYVVFILTLSGVAEMPTAMSRVIYTVEGGLLALCAYAIWPTWAGSTAGASLATMLHAQSAYVGELLGAYADPRQIDLGRLGQLRAVARLARSNAEAVVERMLAEPASRASIAPRAALGLLAALRRHALGALALHAGLERGVDRPVPGMAALTAQVTESLTALAAAAGSGTVPAALPPLRQTQLALPPSATALVGEETDLMVDSINTIADLLSASAAGVRSVRLENRQ